MKRIILASNSPRRRELLAKQGVKFDVIPSDFEEWLDDTMPPEEVAATLGYGKAYAVAKKYPEAIVIGSDTIVTIDDKQLGKAENNEAALLMWRMLAGRSHKVTTSVVVLCLTEKYEYTIVDNTTVYLKPFDGNAIQAYLDIGSYKDKAGAYAIQDAPNLVDHIDGDIETVIGLPMRLLQKPLVELGIKV